MVATKEYLLNAIKFPTKFLLNFILSER